MTHGTAEQMLEAGFVNEWTVQLQCCSLPIAFYAMSEDTNDGDTTSQTTTGTGNPSEFWVPDAIPAATVIVVRDSNDERGSEDKRTGDGIVTLMLRRDAGLTFAAGMWVFPGGRIDDSDLNQDEGSASGAQLEWASRRTAARETVEEAGLSVDPTRMVRWSHWTAPKESPRRFTTAFYLAALEGDHPDVSIDDREIREFLWLSPAEVLERHRSGELGLTPPTFITLTQLLPFRGLSELLELATSRPVEHFSTRFGFIDDMMIAMYHGDAGYEVDDVGAVGKRHRLSMGPTWTYERDD